jgi:hypothetical protein
VIVAVPDPTAVINPVDDTFATLVLLLVQVTRLSVAFAGETVALNLILLPFNRVIDLLLRETPVTGCVTLILQVAAREVLFTERTVIVTSPEETHVTLPELFTVATLIS